MVTVWAAPAGEPVTLTMLPSYDCADCPPLDHLPVPGGLVAFDATKGPALSGFVTRQAASAHAVLFVCTGSFVAHTAGLLEGKRGTTHWICLARLRRAMGFAQFEREVAGERIRDKIAASKRKGMWMGGSVPLGYEAKDRKLVVDEAEAERVRYVFRTYHELGSVRLLHTRLAAEGVTSKSGQRLAHGALFHMLQNPVYRGEVRHKGNVHRSTRRPARWKPHRWSCPCRHRCGVPGRRSRWCSGRTRLSRDPPIPQ